LQWVSFVFGIGVPQPDDQSAWETVLEIVENVSDAGQLQNELLTTGTLVTIAGTLLGAKLLGKRLSDYEDDPANVIRETPDGEWSSVIRVAGGKTVAVFQDDPLLIDFKKGLRTQNLSALSCEAMNTAGSAG
jgi:hypothetical protein